MGTGSQSRVLKVALRYYEHIKSRCTTPHGLSEVHRDLIPTNLLVYYYIFKYKVFNSKERPHTQALWCSFHSQIGFKRPFLHIHRCVDRLPAFSPPVSIVGPASWEQEFLPGSSPGLAPGDSQAPMKGGRPRGPPGGWRHHGPGVSGWIGIGPGPRSLPAAFPLSSWCLLGFLDSRGLRGGPHADHSSVRGDFRASLVKIWGVFQVQPVTCCDLLVFLYEFGGMLSKFP